jgi:hypothetical protein
MEILRFEEAAPVAPKRKKSSKGYLTAGFVAALFGIGTALASATTEIAINDGGGVSLGQGVTLAAACDEVISVVPITVMKIKADVPTFYLTELQINGIDTELTDLEVDPPVKGCGNKYFDIQIFNPDEKIAYTCAQLKTSDAFEVYNEDTLTTDSSCEGEGLNKLSFKIAPSSDVDRTYRIVFDDAPSSISYITLVTRNNA